MSELHLGGDVLLIRTQRTEGSHGGRHPAVNYSFHRLRDIVNPEENRGLTHLRIKVRGSAGIVASLNVPVLVPSLVRASGDLHGNTPQGKDALLRGHVKNLILLGILQPPAHVLRTGLLIDLHMGHLIGKKHVESCSGIVPEDLDSVDVGSCNLLSPVLETSAAQIKPRKLLKDRDGLVSLHRLHRRGIEDRGVAKHPHEGCRCRHGRLLYRFRTVPHGEQYSIVSPDEIEHSVNSLQAHL